MHDNIHSKSKRKLVSTINIKDGGSKGNASNAIELDVSDTILLCALSFHNPKDPVVPNRLALWANSAFEATHTICTIPLLC